MQTGTVIVGASAAGLATAACLKRLGQPFELLEADAQVASSWRRHYDRLHLHTAKSLSALPYLGFPRETPRYPSRDQVIAYLETYAQKLGLAPRFGQRVESVRPEASAWVVRTGASEWRAPNVVIATGSACVPDRPEWPGAFTGRILHSSEYRSGAPFKGQRVLVVGFGNSGGEIAIDLCEQGAHPAIAVRSAVNVIPRDFLGLPILAWGLLLSVLPDAVGNVVARIVSRLSFGRLERYGFRQLSYGVMTQIHRYKRIPLLDVGTLAHIRKGGIEVLPDLLGFDAGTVRFIDGTRKEFEAVILATGFRPALAGLLDGVAGALGAGGAPLNAGQETLPGLYFCGFNIAVPTGGLREIAREARRIARSISAAANRVG